MNLNQDKIKTRGDMIWWFSFIQVFSGHTHMVDPCPLAPLTIDAYTEAAGVHCLARSLYTPWAWCWPNAAKLHINHKRYWFWNPQPRPLCRCGQTKTYMCTAIIAMLCAQLRKAFRNTISRWRPCAKYSSCLRIWLKMRPTLGLSTNTLLY